MGGGSRKLTFPYLGALAGHASLQAGLGTIWAEAQMRAARLSLRGVGADGLAHIHTGTGIGNLARA